MQGFSNLLLLSGPSGGGKSTFAHQLKSGGLPEEIARRLPPGARRWPIVDVTNKMRRQIETEGEAAAIAAFAGPAEVILHYDITTVYRYGLAGYESDPALRLLRLARTASVVFVCPDAERLHLQFVTRDADRQARKSAPARTWNRFVLGPIRRLRLRLSGQALNPERTLYSDPLWLVRCYSAWNTYLSALVGVGAARDILYVAPDEGSGAPRFHSVVAPEQLAARASEESKG